MSKSSKKLSASQLRKFRSDIAALKSKGLVSARVDARSQRPTRHMREQVKKYSDVLSGKAAVVHVPKVKDAKRYSDNFRTKGKSVVVPVEKGEKLSYSKKTGEIRGHRKQGSKKVTKIYQPVKAGKTSDLPRGKHLSYTIPFGRNGRFTFDTIEELELFMSGYEERYKNWQSYVEIERVTAERRAELRDEMEDGE